MKKIVIIFALCYIGAILFTMKVQTLRNRGAEKSRSPICLYIEVAGNEVPVRLGFQKDGDMIYEMGGETCTMYEGSIVSLAQESRKARSMRIDTTRLIIDSPGFSLR